MTLKALGIGAVKVQGLRGFEFQLFDVGSVHLVFSFYGLGL